MINFSNELEVHVQQLIEHASLDKYIEKCLGRPWSLQQNEMAGQNELVSFEVWPDPDAAGPVQDWLESPPAGCPGRLEQPGYGEDIEIYTGQILNELCNRSLLPEGDYTVKAWW